MNGNNLAWGKRKENE